MPLTLEERERIAYITNSPDHPLLVLALDAENDALDEMRHERDTAMDDANRLEDDLDEKEKELSAIEEKLETAERERDELREQLAAKEVPSPQPEAKPVRKSRKVESVADLL